MSALANQQELKQNNISSGGGGCGGCGVFAGIVLLAVVFFVLWIASGTSKRNAEHEASKHRVRADQLAFTDLQMDSPSSSYPRTKWRTFTGRVRNNSQYHVTSIEAKFRVLDCNAQSHCDVVDENTQDFLGYGGVPPGQVRDIDATIYFRTEYKIRGRFQWDYQITEIRADKR